MSTEEFKVLKLFQQLNSKNILAKEKDARELFDKYGEDFIDFITTLKEVHLSIGEMEEKYKEKRESIEKEICSLNHLDLINKWRLRELGEILPDEKTQFIPLFEDRFNFFVELYSKYNKGQNFVYEDFLKHIEEIKKARLSQKRGYRLETYSIIVKIYSFAYLEGRENQEQAKLYFLGRSNKGVAICDARLIQKSNLMMGDCVLLKAKLRPSDGLYVEEIIYPNVPYSENSSLQKKVIRFQEMPLDTQKIIFISDIHVGGFLFNKDLWQLFVNFLQEYSEKYNIDFYLAGGDVIEGVSCYRGQVADLELHDRMDQYAQLSSELKKLRGRIHIILQTGNHDFVRLAEPQPMLPKSVRALFDSNVSFIPNPFILSIKDNLILAYHGRAIDEWLNQLGYYTVNDSTKIQVLMLKKAHLLQTSGGKVGQYALKKDGLLIPRLNYDVFCMGHTHMSGHEIYKNIHVISTSTFQNKKTKTGKYAKYPPNKAVVHIYDLKTKEIAIVDLIKYYNYLDTDV